MQSGTLPRGFPKYWDWRVHDGDALNPVKSQGKCIAAEAGAARLEAKNYTDLLELSSQELLDCCEKEIKRTKCYTYSYTKAFNYIKKEGIRKEEENPFKAVKQPCQPKTQKQRSLAVRINGVIKIDHKNEDEFLMQVKEQPVAGCVIMTTEFTLLKGGIYEGTDVLDKLNQDNKFNLKHSILIIGFGYDEKEEKITGSLKILMAKRGESMDMVELLEIQVFQTANKT